MKRILYLFLIGLAFSSAVSAKLLIAWDGGDGTGYAAQAPGISGSLNSSQLLLIDPSAGSTDGTFGTLFSGANPAATGYKVITSTPGSTDTLMVQITNQTGDGIQIETLSFDYHAWFLNSPKTVTLSYLDGDLNDADHTFINSVSNVDDTTGGKLSDYQDYDWSLAGLSDTVLAQGESARFKLVATDANGTTTGGAFDNIAISGTEIAIAAELPISSIAWHSGSFTPDLTTNGLTATLSVSGAGGTDSSNGSTDESYGTFKAAAPTTGGAFQLYNNDYVEISMTNSTGKKMLLETLRLDFNRRFSGSPTDVTVTYKSGDLDDRPRTLAARSNQTEITSNLADFHDLDCEFRQHLADTMLDAGESATFRITLSGASAAGAAYIDNISITATLTDYIAPPPAQKSTVASVRRPNVVIFYADDVGLGDISAYGYTNTTLVATPNIDALAVQGMRFMNAHTVYATCAPSRYGILSGNLALRGRYFNGTWQAHFASQFLTGQKSIANLFQEANYRTGFFGKTHMGGQLYHPNGSVFNTTVWAEDLTGVDWLRGFHKGPTALGFDYSFLSHDGIQGPPYLYFENDKPVDHFAYHSGSKQWTWAAATSNTAYVYLQSSNPANPGYIATDADGNNVDSVVLYDDGVENTVVGCDYWDSTKTGEIYTQAAKNFIDDHMANHPNEPFYMHYASQCVHEPNTPDTFFGETVRNQELTLHLDMLREMDLQFKALMDKLEEKGILDETIIIYTSDNGGLRYSLSAGHDGSGPFRGNKSTSWEGGHRVPFIIRWGGGNATNSIVPPGTVCEQVISQTDLFATFATLLDQPQDSTDALDSMNILPYFMGEFTPVIRDHLIAAHNEYSFHLGGWKIIVSYASHANFTPLAVTEMYHLASDPFETTDLSADPNYAEMSARMLAELIAKVAASRSTVAMDSDADGLFDSWETAMAGNLTTYDAALLSSTADTDGDGVTDRSEYALRSNPAVSDAQNNSIQQSLPGGNIMQIGWNSQYGRFYSIEERTNLIAGAWTQISGSYPGHGGYQEVDVPIQTSNGFYRVILKP